MMRRWREEGGEERELGEKHVDEKLKKEKCRASLKNKRQKKLCLCLAVFVSILKLNSHNKMCCLCVRMV